MNFRFMSHSHVFITLPVHVQLHQQRKWNERGENCLIEIKECDFQHIQQIFIIFCTQFICSRNKIKVLNKS